ncbi:hypothetical protein BSKO_06542 [Bryopsis sp. KO-2023]|nr:hypothetical protein BSKO_06542 [Bryopsis sp. KO-2023]
MYGGVFSSKVVAPVASAAKDAGRLVAKNPRWGRLGGRRSASTIPFAKGLQELLSLQIEKSRPDPLVPGEVSPFLTVPSHIGRPSYADTGKSPPFDGNEYEIHDAEGIKRMRASGKLAAQVLQHAGTLAKEGVTTDEIDKAVHKMIVDNNAYPSPLNYGNFPKSVCTSINECYCHGIPDSRPLKDGDLLNIDVTVYLNGYHGDCSKMFFIGNVSEEGKRVAEVAKQCRDSAIAICAPGVEFMEIGAVIQDIAHKNKCTIMKDFVGHGVGKVFHAAPYVHHHRNRFPGVMKENMTFTIEPIICTGNGRSMKTWDDKWTVVAPDGSLSAQLEHTILITKDGSDILTLP